MRLEGPCNIFRFNFVYCSLLMLPSGTCSITLSHVIKITDNIMQQLICKKSDISLVTFVMQIKLHVELNSDMYYNILLVTFITRMIKKLKI